MTLGRWRRLYLDEHGGSRVEDRAKGYVRRAPHPRTPAIRLVVTAKGRTSANIRNLIDGEAADRRLSSGAQTAW
jgi:hypothetical protein